jgi:hypothetical protein
MSQAGDGDPYSAMIEQGFTGLRSSDPAQILRELADREELRELTARYAHLVARKQSAAPLFTEDGGFVFRTPDGDVREARGRQALEAIFADILRPPNHNLPTVHNHVISIIGDSAIGVCWIELHASKEGEEWLGSGYYQDEFRREGGRWKFVVRDSTLVKWERVR